MKHRISTRAVVLSGVAVALLLAAVVSFYASGSPDGLERVAEWKRLIGGIPLIAIGGMSVERAAGAFEAGADVVSAVTDITLNDDPEARVRQWLEATR